MVTVKRRYRYVYEDVSRHGQVRLYFWRGKGYGKIRMRATLGAKAFEDLYDSLLNQVEAGALTRAPRDTPRRGTLRWLGVLYSSSAEFGQLDPSTQTVARRTLDSIYSEPVSPRAAEVFGDCPLASFTAKSVAILRDRKKATPEAANMRLKRLRAMFKWALKPENADLGVTANPARDVAKLSPKRKGGFPRWTPGDLDKFEARYALGSKQRLALALLMYTGVRRSDVVRLGPPMEQDGVLTWTQHKGRNRNPIEVSIPIIPELREMIEATAAVGATTYLVTQYGKPFTDKGFGQRMGAWCADAGLPGKNSHGVRKAAATRAAERGASAHALMAMFGWLDIKQAELYTRDASRRKLARDNAHLLGGGAAPNLSHLGPQLQAGGKEIDEKPNDIREIPHGWRPVGESNPCFQRERLAS
jgi:integrase